MKLSLFLFLTLNLVFNFSYSQGTDGWKEVEVAQGKFKVPPTWSPSPLSEPSSINMWVGEEKGGVFSTMIVSVPVETTLKMYSDYLVWEVRDTLPQMAVVEDSIVNAGWGGFAYLFFKTSIDQVLFDNHFAVRKTGSDMVVFCLTRHKGNRDDDRKTIEKVLSTFESNIPEKPQKKSKLTAHWCDVKGDFVSVRCPCIFKIGAGDGTKTKFQLINPISLGGGELSEIVFARMDRTEEVGIEELYESVLASVQKHGTVTVMSSSKKVPFAKEGMVVEWDVNLPGWGRSYQRLYLVRKNGIIQTVLYRIAYENRYVFEQTLELLLESVVFR